MTNLEVMLIRRMERAAQTGDDASCEAVLDRLIGKPLAKSESLKVVKSYEDFLRETAQKVKDVAPAPVDAEVVPPGAEL